MTRRAAEALLLALLLLAVQAAVLAHEHDGSVTQSATQGCELCVGQASTAPPPEPGFAFHLERRMPCLPVSESALPASRRPASAHRSRAPPAFHSI